MTRIALKLRPVSHPKGDANRYCGPSAISSLTGMGTGEAARLIRATSRKTSVKGTSNLAMFRALARCGIEPSTRWSPPPKATMTLAAWFRFSTGKRGGKVFLIAAGNHWQLVSGNRFVCGRTGAIVPIDDPKVRRRSHVETVWTLEAPRGVSIPEAARKPKVRRSTAASTAKRLAALWGIEIDPDSRTPGDLTFWVYGPDAIYQPDEDGDPPEGDPCCGEHFCAGWDEVLEKVETYVADLRERGIEPASRKEADDDPE